MLFIVELRSSNSFLISTIEFNPLYAALTTLEGLVLRHTFVVIFLIPNTSEMALRVPPAFIPVPSGAGFNNTTLPQNLDLIS